MAIFDKRLAKTLSITIEMGARTVTLLPAQSSLMTISIRTQQKPNMNHPNMIRPNSRADAIRRGELLEVTASATPLGYRLPVAITRAAWAKYVHWPATQRAAVIAPEQSPDSRLTDLLAICMAGIRETADNNIDADHLQLQFDCINNETGIPQRGDILILMHAGDMADHIRSDMVFTLMLPDEL